MSIHDGTVTELHPLAHDALEGAVAATRAELERAVAVEYRAASLHALVVAYNHRFVTEATADLQSAVDALARAGESRAEAVERVAPYLKIAPESPLRELVAASPEPYASELSGLRAELVAASLRVAQLEADSVEILGAQMALVAEVLAGYDRENGAVYGREVPSRPRMLRGVW